MAPPWHHCRASLHVLVPANIQRKSGRRVWDFFPLVHSNHHPLVLWVWLRPCTPWGRGGKETDQSPGPSCALAATRECQAPTGSGRGHRVRLATSWGQRPLWDPDEAGGRLLREARPGRQGGEGWWSPPHPPQSRVPAEVRCLQGAAPREVLCFKLLGNGQHGFSCEL